MTTTIIRRRGLGMSSAKGIAEFSNTGIDWVRNDKELPKSDVYIRWGCTSSVPTRNVINTARAIHEVNDKAAFRIKCADAGLSPPSMLLSELEECAIEDKGLSFPVVVRPIRHAQGRNIYLCKDEVELKVAYWNVNGEGYVSNFVDKVAEYRVAVVSGRAVWVVKKTPDNPDALAWNVSRGGRFDNVRWGSWPLSVVDVALMAFNLSQLDFGGVDVMVDADGNATVLEINSAPSLTSPYRQECMAKAFDYIEVNGKQRIPIAGHGSWKDCIHPAISDAAEV